MSETILEYDDSLTDSIVSLFNREHERFDLIVPLTSALFRDRVASKSLFRSSWCFAVVERGKVVAFALTSYGANNERTLADPGVGVIDGLFFSPDRFATGEMLLGHCIQFLRAQGVRLIYGFASLGGYPFWREIYCGAEPACLTDYRHAWIAFMAQGFEHHQQSLNYMGKPSTMPHRPDLRYEVTDLDISSSWAADSWRGLRPRVLEARKDGELKGSIGFVSMPLLSERRGVSMAGIYSMSVAESARRQGIASSMMGFLYEWLGDGAVRSVLVGTTVENAAARRTYEKAGMRVVGFRSGTRKTYGGTGQTGRAMRSDREGGL